MLFQTMFLSWIPMVMSVIYYPKPSLAYRDLRTYVLLVIFSSRGKRRKTALCLSLCFIDESSLCNSFFHNITQICAVCFRRVVLDSKDSRKWIFASLNKLVHWKVGFQSLGCDYELGHQIVPILSSVTVQVTLHEEYSMQLL